MATTLNAATFMGKNFSTIQSVVKNHESLTLKQMFDVTAQLVNNQEEINCLDKILYGKNSWTHLSLINDEVVSHQSSKHKSMYSQILCSASERFFNIPNPTKLGRIGLQEPKPREATEIMTLSVESRRNSSGIFDQDPQRCISVIKSAIFWALWDKHQKLSQKGFSLCQCSMTSPVTRTATKMNVERMLNLWKHLREDSVLDNGLSLDHFLRKSGILPAWDNIAEEMLLEFAESPHPIFRATTPLSRGQLKSKGRGKLSIHLTADRDTVDTI